MKTEALENKLKVTTMKLDNRMGKLKDLDINQLLEEENQTLTNHVARMAQD